MVITSTAPIPSWLAVHFGSLARKSLWFSEVPFTAIIKISITLAELATVRNHHLYNLYVVQIRVFHFLPNPLTSASAACILRGILNLRSIENSKPKWIVNKMNLLLFRKLMGNRKRYSLCPLLFCFHCHLYPLLSQLIKMAPHKEYAQASVRRRLGWVHKPSVKLHKESTT